jgi:hypothetical protein
VESWDGEVEADADLPMVVRAASRTVLPWSWSAVRREGITVWSMERRGGDGHVSHPNLKKRWLVIVRIIMGGHYRSNNV